MPNQSAKFFSKKKVRYALQTLSYAQVTQLSSKSSDFIFPEIEAIDKEKTDDYRTMTSLSKKIGELIEPYRANTSKMSSLEIAHEVLHNYLAAYSSRANLQLRQKQCNTRQVD